MNCEKCFDIVIRDNNITCFVYKKSCYYQGMNENGLGENYKNTRANGFKRITRRNGKLKKKKKRPIAKIAKLNLSNN